MCRSDKVKGVLKRVIMSKESEKMNTTITGVEKPFGGRETMLMSTL